MGLQNPSASELQGVISWNFLSVNFETIFKLLNPKVFCAKSFISASLFFSSTVFVSFPLLSYC